MKVYVAAASSEIERAEKWMTMLRAAGIKVVSTWPEVIRKVGEANPMNGAREERTYWAATDLAEVSTSEVFWFLLPDGKPTMGAYTELGYAVALGAMSQEARNAGIIDAPNYWLVCSGVETSIFTALADHFTTDEEAFRALTLRQTLVGSLKKPISMVQEARSAPDEGG